MTAVLVILGWGLFGLVVAAGLALDLAGLFGNWLILAALGGVWALTGFEHFGAWTMLLLAGVAGVGEALEMLAAGYGAAKFGGGRGAVISALGGCLVGAVIGTPWFPVVGTLAGACVGAFAGATAHELLLMEKKPGEAVWTGLGAALGKVAGVFAKLIAGIAMLCVAALTY